jgi:hypothetical protein
MTFKHNFSLSYFSAKIRKKDLIKILEIQKLKISEDIDSKTQRLKDTEFWISGI